MSLFEALGLPEPDEDAEAKAEAPVEPATKPAAAVEPAPVSKPSSLPSVGRQKTFIVENASVLNKETKIAILSIVMMEIGPSVVMETGGAKEVDIDLDAVLAANEEVLGHVYNIVRARLETLNQPARAGGNDQGTGGRH